MRNVAQDSGLYRPLPLLPYRFRYAGYILILLSFGSAYLYFFGGRPSFFEVPVFAIATSYAETRWFVISQTNLLDELSVAFVIVALLFIAFSREQTESIELDKLRGRALLYSAYATAIIWVFLYVSIFGWPMIVVSATIFLLFLVTYILAFQLLRRNLTTTTSNKNQMQGMH